MESLYGFCSILSLLLLASTINARTTPEEYWKQVMKDQPMPDALKGLVNSNPLESVSKDVIKTDCHTSLNTKYNKHLANDVLTDDPTVTAFYGDVKQKENEDTKGTKSAINGDVKQKETEDGIDNKHLTKNFLTDASLAVFNGHNDATKMEEKVFVNDFEPRPNLSVYHDVELKDQKKAFAEVFEPRPNASVYSE